MVKRTGSEVGHHSSDPASTPTLVTLGKSFNLLMPQFPLCKMGIVLVPTS